MELRTAAAKDLPCLREMYREIDAHMAQTGIGIWNESYPCDFLEEDIQNRRLYLLEEAGVPAAAFALCLCNDGEKAVRWQRADSAARYLDRLGVNPEFMRRGVASLALQKAAEIAGREGAEYLRLFVVRENLPALCLYRKSGFSQADGVFDEEIGDGVFLREYGFEKKL